MDADTDCVCVCVDGCVHIFPFSKWEVSSSISFRQQSVCNNRLYATASLRVFSLTPPDTNANFISLPPDVFLDNQD